MFDIIHCSLRLKADPTRRVVRPFHPANGSNGSDVRRIVDYVAALDEATAGDELERVLRDFDPRRWQARNMFDARFARIEAELGLGHAGLSEVRRRLIGAFFCHAHGYAAAALTNPGVVPHPDQSGMGRDAVRIIISLRAVGEGHIGSVAFREGILGPGPVLDLMPEPPFATAADGAGDPGGDAIAIHRHRDSSLSGTVLFPMTEAQREGLEDLRLVRFTHDDGAVEWLGTYSAHDGVRRRPELLRTSDFRSFTLAPMSAPAAQGRGMALFPRKIGGRYAMIGRRDNATIVLMTSDRLDAWGEGVPLLSPVHAWEQAQIGICGSPIEIDEGWIVLTHGVGAMRKYAIGAVLLDKADPSKVIGRAELPLIAATQEDHEGYRPNVVYSCGAMRHGEHLFVPYGVADSSVAFGFVALGELLAALK
ncbi:glycoside hydrolase family 130 protein [Sphingomonas crocodyli]|uniref:Glycosidase n=1 Tax=Sphingomonas crocodyli TaxID=1979270 RepID=A0A437M4B2_9SPHN|nr:glycoside hydrolase family 130 protein [Sphingomonas crocodyli]RVT92518.1 glycosidase [Sphingomonas crocodyli]